jgi:hypothetical protein
MHPVNRQMQNNVMINEWMNNGLVLINAEVWAAGRCQQEACRFLT